MPVHRRDDLAIDLADQRHAHDVDGLGVGDAAAAGYADAAVEPDRLDITVNGVLLCKGGVAAGGRTDADLSGKEVLAEALPWLQRFHGRIVVIKYGGHAMIDEELKQAFARDMVFLRLGQGEATVLTTDLSHAYIDENRRTS